MVLLLLERIAMKEPKKSTVSSKEFAPPDLTASKRYVIAMAVLVYAAVTWIILNVVDQTQPIPYLDEIYHVPQAQEYCKGNLTYVRILLQLIISKSYWYLFCSGITGSRHFPAFT